MSPGSTRKRPGPKSQPFSNSFTGDYRYTLDHRGRINFPAPFRRVLSDDSGDCVVVAKGPDGCLYVLPKDVWERRRMEISNSLYPSDLIRRLQREVTDGARDSTFDAQGRINIPLELIQWAKLKKEVLIKGVGDRVELWNPQVYQEYKSRSGMSFEEMIEKYFSQSSSNLNGSPDKGQP